MNIFRSCGLMIAAAMLLLGSTVAYAQQTTDQIVKFGPGGSLVDSTITEDPVSGNVGIGTTTPTTKLAVAGNASQGRADGGFVKAMVFVNTDGTIARCYNGITDSSAGDCGFSVTRPSPGFGVYIIDFGFQVDDRFYSATPVVGDPFFFPFGVNVSRQCFPTTANQVCVVTFSTSAGSRDAPFHLIVY